MAKCILDTDILSEYLKGHDQAVTKHAVLYAQEHRVFTFTSVTVYEIIYGLELKGTSRQRQKAWEWLQQNEEVTPTKSDYFRAATIRATARKQGFVLELPDCLINLKQTKGLYKVEINLWATRTLSLFNSRQSLNSSLIVEQFLNCGLSR